MQHDAWFFIGIFAFIFIIWIAVGGPTHSISFAGPTLSEPSPIGGGTYLRFPRSPFGIGDSDVALEGISEGGGASGRSEISASSLKGVDFGTPSLYRNFVSLRQHVFGAASSDSKKEYVELSISQTSSVPIDITGWSLLSGATTNMATVPKGTEVPRSGTINEIENIVLSAGEKAIIVSGQSPIGASFRENKCIGYFSTFQKFYPSLPQNCPLPSDEFEKFYGSNYVRDTDCMNFVKKLSRCQVTLTPPVNSTTACQNFIVKYLNYNGCVEAHKNDVDFKGNTWRVYLDHSDSMWRQKDEVIKLLDTGGKTVDAFSY